MLSGLEWNDKKKKKNKLPRYPEKRCGRTESVGFYLLSHKIAQLCKIQCPSPIYLLSNNIANSRPDNLNN